jgi:dihydroxy-acid dehydratase
MGEALERWDIARTTSERCATSSWPRPAACRRRTAFSQSRRWDDLDLDRENGRDPLAEHAVLKDGGLAVLYGNIASTAAS